MQNKDRNYSKYIGIMWFTIALMPRNCATARCWTCRRISKPWTFRTTRRYYNDLTLATTTRSTHWFPHVIFYFCTIFGKKYWPTGFDDLPSSKFICTLLLPLLINRQSASWLDLMDIFSIKVYNVKICISWSQNGNELYRNSVTKWSLYNTLTALL